MTADESLNALLNPWSGKHGGIPRFDLVKIQDFKPAILKGMDIQRAEIKAITGRTDKPTFENTIESLEDSGRPLSRATAIFEIYISTMNNKEMQLLESELKPLLAMFQDEIIQNDELFHRIKIVYDTRCQLELTPEQERLINVLYHNFKQQGAGLATAKKARLREINETLAGLFTEFRHNLLAEEENYFLVLESPDDLSGLPDTLRNLAAEQARERGLNGKWIITNTRSAMEPFLSFSSRRDLRQKAWQLWINRACNDNAHNNKATISQILQLRAERAKLLGFSDHAHLVLDKNMAKTPAAALDLLLSVWKAAVNKVKEEVADMQIIAEAENANITIAPWDYRYYQEKVRKARYDIDENELKQYLQLDQILSGMFWAANQAYGLEMVPLTGVPVVHPHVTAWEVRRQGKRIGLWYFDPYARKGKNSGAWMSEYRLQENFRGTVLPVVSNNANFVKGLPGEPTLISFDDAKTLFHEFGHALHGLESAVSYPSLACTNVKRDFVEFPSQINERWLRTPEMLTQFALHYQTGKHLPPRLIKRIHESRVFNQGFITAEYLAAAIYDMLIHLSATPDKIIDPNLFEQETMAEIGCPKEIIMRHRPTNFAHIFAGEEYSAGYYVYLWAEAMSADAAAAFTEAGSFYDSATCKRLRDTIFAVGNAVAPEVAFRNFRGRNLDTTAYMRDHGFLPA